MFTPVFLTPVKSYLDTSTGAWHRASVPGNPAEFLADESLPGLRKLVLAIPEVRQLLDVRNPITFAKQASLGQLVGQQEGSGSPFQVILTDKDGRVLERVIQTNTGWATIPENRMNMLEFHTPSSGSFLMNAGALAVLADQPGEILSQFMAALSRQQDFWDKEGGA